MGNNMNQVHAINDVGLTIYLQIAGKIGFTLVISFSSTEHWSIVWLYWCYMQNWIIILLGYQLCRWCFADVNCDAPIVPFSFCYAWCWWWLVCGAWITRKHAIKPIFALVNELCICLKTFVQRLQLINISSAIADPAPPTVTVLSGFISCGAYNMRARETFVQTHNCEA